MLQKLIKFFIVFFLPNRASNLSRDDSQEPMEQDDTK